MFFLYFTAFIYIVLVFFFLLYCFIYFIFISLTSCISFSQSSFSYFSCFLHSFIQTSISHPPFFPLRKYTYFQSLYRICLFPAFLYCPIPLFKGIPLCRQFCSSLTTFLCLLSIISLFFLSPTSPYMCSLLSYPLTIGLADWLSWLAGAV